MKKEYIKRVIAWTLVAVLLIAAGWYRWIWLHKDNPTAVELWGRMDKAAQQKLLIEINRSYIKLHPECRRSALEINSYPEAIVIMVKCDDGRNDEGIGSVHHINFIEH
jgi:hypothetical protein